MMTHVILILFILKVEFHMMVDTNQIYLKD